MANLEIKRDQFRNYLERSGVVDSLSTALVKLYEELDKPENAVRFVRRYMCPECKEEDELQKCQETMNESNKIIDKLQRDLEGAKLKIIYPAEEIKAAVEQALEALKPPEGEEVQEEQKSMIQEILTPELIEELSKLRTPRGGNLYDCVRSGLEVSTAKIGVFSTDIKCYDVFENLFKPIITQYHMERVGLAADTQQPALNWGEIDSLGNLDPDDQYITFCQITCSRNLKDFPFFSRMSEKDYSDVEKKVMTVFKYFEGDIKGNYFPLENLTEEKKAALLEENFLFNNDNIELASGGGYRFWPTGRGVFHSDQNNFFVWVNQEDHMLITSLSKTGNLGKVYRQQVEALINVDTNLEIARHGSYGIVTANPTKLGTSLMISCKIKLLKLSEDMEALLDMADKLNLVISNPNGGETSAIEGGVMLITNKRCYGASENDITVEFYEGVQELINAESQR